MNDKLEYPGKELEIFDKATIWRNYLYLKIKKFIGKNILEVGAGMGSFSKTYYNNKKKISLSELDNNLVKILKKRFINYSNVLIKKNFIKNIQSKFDTILYISVLEHIKNDNKELKLAVSKLKKKGHLVICVPAHNYMYSKFDKEIGHYRRYQKKFFNDLKFKNAYVEKCYMLDCIGWLVYFFNKIFFKNEDYPSKTKVQIWDKFLVPISILLDFFTFYKFGKNIICIIKKL